MNRLMSEIRILLIAIPTVTTLGLLAISSTTRLFGRIILRSVAWVHGVGSGTIWGITAASAVLVVRTLEGTALIMPRIPIMRWRVAVVRWGGVRVMLPVMIAHGLADVLRIASKSGQPAIEFRKVSLGREVTITGECGT